MASIRKRPNGSWRARYRDVAGREHARHFKRKVDAQRWLDEVTASLTRGDYVDPVRSRVSVGTWAERWLEGQLHLKESTKARYEGILRKQILPTWGKLPLSEVTHADTSAWVASLSAQGLAPSTVRQAHRVFSLLLDLAVRDARLARNPAVGVRLPRATPAEKRFLSHEQVRALAEATTGHQLVVLVLAYCGLRWGELAALRVEDLDLMRRRLEVTRSVTEVHGRLVWGTPKTHQRRSVPVPGFLVDELARHVAGKAPEDLVFTSPEGKILRNLNFRHRVLDPAARTVGLDGLTPHELRHTAASLAVSAGANVKAVQRMLGHASAAMTLDVYSGLFDDDIDTVAERLDSARLRARADSLRTEATVTDLGGHRASV